MALYELGDLTQETGGIIHAAMEVHRHLGPGLLESAYHACLVHELRSRGTQVDVQRAVPLTYKGIVLPCAYRLDLVVSQRIVVEVKTVAEIAPIHEAQMITYLRLTGCAAGLILNFNSPTLRDGIRRLLNSRPATR